MESGDEVDRVHVDEIMRDIRERARQRRERTAASGRTSRWSMGSRVSSALDAFPLDHIGDAPPSPPTLRGRIGGIAARLIYHGLHWYTTRLRQFAAAVKSDAEEHARILRALSPAVDDLSAGVQRQKADIDALRLEVEALRTELLAIQQGLEEHRAVAARNFQDHQIRP